jgi:Holliday junction resolvase RusA-like endonuclease
MKITLDYPPSSNRYWRVAQNRIYRSADAIDYIQHVALLCNRAGVQPMQGDVRVTLHFYRPAKRGDLDNRVKILLDAMRFHVYADDSQVAEIHATRHEDKTNPRVEIEVTPL